MHVR
ncbi:hypothetical protein AB1N83_007690 [Pleurotus pulmonarius]|jgi:secreted Zn-dependent insulinase-like peptidase